MNLTSGFTPVTLDFVISIRLVADKPFRPLFDDSRAINWPYCHFVVIFVKRYSEPRGDTAARKGRRNRQQLSPFLEQQSVFIAMYLTAILWASLRQAHLKLFFCVFAGSLLYRQLRSSMCTKLNTHKIRGICKNYDRQNCIVNLKMRLKKRHVCE